MKSLLPSDTNTSINARKDRMSLRVIDIVIIGMMSAILLAVQVALAFLPNVELVTLLIILYTLVYGRKTIYIIYVFAILEGIIYGFGLWWYGYLYIWTILFIITILFKKVKTALLWAVIAGGYGLIFGALYSIPYFIFGGIATGFAYWVAGIPFDITHGIANFAVTLVLFHPLYMILDKITKRTENMN